MAIILENEQYIAMVKNIADLEHELDDERGRTLAWRHQYYAAIGKRTCRSYGWDACFGNMDSASMSQAYANIGKREEGTIRKWIRKLQGAA